GSNVDTANDGPDNDGDGICDTGDTDDDNDGVSDTDEATNGTDPNDPSECGDSDADGCDDCSATANTDFTAGSNVDTANDGPDNDGDGICDTGDTDDDNDGNPDITDPNPLVPITRDDLVSIIENTTGSVNILSNDDFLPGPNTTITDLGTGTASGIVFFDPSTGIMQYTPVAGEEGTAVTVVYQVCHSSLTAIICENATVTITVQTDTDDDGIPDVTDTDDDNDGNPDTTDPNPLIANTENDTLTVIDGTIGIIDILDNDDFIPGPNISIIDTGAGTASGNITFDNLTGEMSYAPASDEDGLTVLVEYQVCNNNVSPAVCETALVTIIVVKDDADNDGIPNSIDLDDDNDGIPDSVEQGDTPDLDTDNDGIIDSLDLDADGDGVSDLIESGHQGIDANNDGQLDGPYGSDGIADSVQSTPDNGTINYTPIDTDGDGIDDYQDIDDDGDGINTEDESTGAIEGVTTDADGDGIPDYLDPNNADTTVDDDLEVFNVVTPNGDGDHDVLSIRNIEKFPSNEIQIFNRWGVVVYKAIGYGVNGEYFRGESNGRTTISKDKMLPVGTYFYILTYKTETGETKQRSDYLYINR
uniref:gliding motility-associated C-terminal domain-containing protein n=1 Tax=Aquimarina pacifica TaxID=1296415 RepID=UPI00046F0C32